jgi:homoserine dehydrogenase
VNKRYGVGLLGAGTVGGGVIRLINEELSHQRLPLDIRRVGVRNLSKNRNFNLPASCLSENLEGIVEDKSIDILVEAMGGLEPARTYIEKALKAGKHVVTANKYVVSECGDYLQELAASRHKHFLYEASVAGSIPVIEILRQGVIPDRIGGLYAILNGTTNFILTRMSESRESFDLALAKACELGFSEPDPTFDISGADAGQKLAILVSIFKGQPCHPSDLNIRGIDSLTPLDFEFADNHQWRIKPFAIYDEVGDKGFASVEPVLIPVDSVLANVRNEYNALCFDCQNVGMQAFIGKGAGELPTASAILGDLSKIVTNNGSLTIDLPTRSFGERVRFCSGAENPRASQFYIKWTKTQDPDKNAKVERILDNLSEVTQECFDKQLSRQVLCAVTKAIPHVELAHLMDLVRGVDHDALVSWLRVVPELS